MKSPFFASTTPAVARRKRPVCTLVIDAEEDFDWDVPLQGTSYSTAHMKNLHILRGVLSAYGIVPVYLLTYPVLNDPDAVRTIRRQVEQGHCAVGVQLHSWVTPPFDEVTAHRTSFSGNLETDSEERKLLVLNARFQEVFGFAPTIFRSGRYGLSLHTAQLLEKHGFLIDTSVAPRTNFAAEGGPDYTDHEYDLFWFGEQRDLLEIPLCRSIVGWAGPLAPALYEGLSGPLLSGLHVASVLTRSRCAERITLSPEGNDVAAMRRLLTGLLARGQDIFALSFHSSSLQAGRNPYVGSKAEMHGFYDRLSEVLDFMASSLAVRFASIEQIPALLDRPVRQQGQQAGQP